LEASIYKREFGVWELKRDLEGFLIKRMTDIINLPIQYKSNLPGLRLFFKAVALAEAVGEGEILDHSTTPLLHSY
jgi:hypothetical protein